MQTNEVRVGKELVGHRCSKCGGVYVFLYENLCNTCRENIQLKAQLETINKIFTA
jgi:uncharacterized OB-fold protein